MFERPLGVLIYLGTCLRYLLDAQPGWAIKGTDERHCLLENIDEYFNLLNELQLGVTDRASKELRKFREEISQLPENTLSADHARRLNRIVLEIRPTLYAESDGMIAYLISERRYPIKHLTSNANKLFAEKVFQSMPELAKMDFAEGAKCLAFERPTASAFHVLRATEMVLREYYCRKVKRNRATLMWGSIVSSMKNFPRRFPVELVNQLDHIRSSFRNPTAHPEKMYDLDEAQDLLSICIDAVNRMTLKIS